MGQIEEMCDQVVWMDHGQVKALGPARDVVRSYLEQVNAAEDVAHPERAASGAQVRGSGQISLDALALLDAEGQEVPALVNGESGTIRLTYTARESVPNVSFRVEVMTEDRICVSAPDSGIAGEWSVSAGRGTVDLDIADFTINPGVYGVNTLISSRGHVLDRREQFLELRVRSRGQSQGGLVSLRGGWSLIPGEQP